MKRIYITLGVLLVGVIAMAYLYFSNLNTETNANSLSLNLVASNAGIVFSFENDKSFYDILNGQDLFQHVLGSNKAKQFNSLKDNLATQPEISNAINGQKLYIGFLAGLNDQVNYLITTQLQSNHNPQKIINSLRAKTTKIGNVYQITFPDSTICYIGIKVPLVVISDALLPVQHIMAKQQSTDQNFANYIKTNSRFNKNTLANLYLDFNKIPVLLKNSLNSNLNGELNIFNKQNTYAALSYNFSSNKLLFNGSTTINTSNSYYKLFEKIGEQKITINTILPQKTANYTAYAIADYNNWYKNLKLWMAQNKEEEKVDKLISRINQKYQLELQQVFPKYFKNQFLTFQLSSGEKFGAIALNNGEKVEQLLLDLSGEYAPDIKVFREADILYAFFGEPFKKFERPFYTIIDNYLIVANNASSIQSFLNSYKNNNLLTSDKDYQDFSNQLSSSATISFYINNKNSNDIFGRNLKPTDYKHYQATVGLKPFEAFAYQLSGDNGKFLSNLLMYKRSEVLNKADTLKVNP